jgi:hypothetical protein
MSQMQQSAVKLRKDPGARSENEDTEKGIKLLLARMVVLILLMAACAPQDVAPSQPTSTAASVRTAAPLGPTSTSPPASTSIASASPTPTLYPLPPISEDDWSRGPANASAVLLVYSDFQ